MAPPVLMCRAHQGLQYRSRSASELRSTLDQKSDDGLPLLVARGSKRSYSRTIQLRPYCCSAAATTGTFFSLAITTAWRVRRKVFSKQSREELQCYPEYQNLRRVPCLTVVLLRLENTP